MKLMDIDSEHLGIPETDYDVTLRMPSVEFQRICRDLASIGDTVGISVTKDGVKFSTTGDIGEANITVRQNSEDDKDKMIAKLVHDNELLMGEVQALDQTLRETREAYSQLRQEKAALEASSTTGQRLLDTVGEQAALDRRERERDRRLRRGSSS